MSSAPSVKGSVFSGVSETVKKLLERGDLSRDEAARWLEPADFELLDGSILVSSWYDIGAFTRMNELLRDVEGGGSNEYLRNLGRESAKRLLETGLYSQLEYLRNTRMAQQREPKARFEAFGRDLRLLVTMSSSIYNFVKWTPEPDPDWEFRYIVILTEAAALSDVMCWRADGFLNQMAAEHGSPELWAWKRTAPDVIRFRMLHDL